jgi:transcriptional repressor NrdR
VGLAILGPLRDLDLVAYLRFASVYRAFDTLDDFEKEISSLRETRDGGGGGSGEREGPADPDAARRRAPAGRSVETPGGARVRVGGD